MCPPFFSALQLFVCASVLPEHSRGRGSDDGLWESLSSTVWTRVLNLSGKVQWQAPLPTEPVLSYSV